MKYGDKWPTIAKQWDAMKLSKSREPEFKKLAEFAIANKDRYQQIERQTNVPWPMIAVLHRRESDANFNTYLGNGEPLNRVTRLVPKGRGPWKSFEDGAVDALTYDGLTTVKDWRLEKMLWYCEKYNGLGYEKKGLPSPYVWGGTNIQKPGKYVADGVWDSTVMDKQPGCAPILFAINKFDPSVQYARET
jgi:lysozyme family protein